MRIKILEGQTIFDIAVQYYGGIDGLVDLKKRNPEVVTSYEVELEAGVELEIGEVVNQEVVDDFKRRGADPATGLIFLESDEENTGVYGLQYGNQYD